MENLDRITRLKAASVINQTARFVCQIAVLPCLVIALLCCFTTQRAFAAPGDLDPTFGTGGIVTTNTQGAAMALQPDGKIVVAGRISPEQFSDFAIVRYNPNGSLDSGFGTNGRVVLPVGNFSDYAQAVIVQPNGKLVVAGYAATDSGSSNYNFAVVRLNADGSLDSTFNGNGKVTTAVGGSGSSAAYSAVLQSDGKIILAGSRGGFLGDFALVRYNPDGSLDAGFGSSGQIVTAVGSSFDAVRSVAVQPDGKIVAAGEADAGSFAKWGVVRYNPDGSLDTNFAANGKLLGSFRSGNDYVSALALQSDGRFVIAGGSQNTGNQYDFAVARYSLNGTPDNSFGSNGAIITPVRASSGANAVSLQPDGKIVVAGYSDITINGSRNSALVRYKTDGSLDTGFGASGVVINASAGTATALTVQPDGKIVMLAAPANGHIVARYLGDAAISRRPTFDFDGDGKTDYGVFRPANGVWYLLNSTSGFTAAAFGTASDKLVPADFDGDGKTDLAVYRSGTWYLQRSQAGFLGIAFGAADDIPVSADYTGDGKSEIAVFRPSNGTWYFYNLASNQTSGIAFGASGDKPTPADYDGDGKADVAVFRPSNGTWYLQRSTAGFTGVAFGVATDKPVAADFDGDGKADIAVARQTNGTTVWYILGSTNGFYGVQFGADTDKLAAGDYDGDGKTDVGVWRNSTGAFYVLKSSGNLFSAVSFGQSGDAPVVSSFVQ